MKTYGVTSRVVLFEKLAATENVQYIIDTFFVGCGDWNQFVYEYVEDNAILRGVSKMKPIKLDFYSTASHGYMKISKYDLESLNIKVKDVASDFSYYCKDNGCFYLEEDCDTMKLLNILKSKNIDFKITEKEIACIDYLSPPVTRVNSNHV